VPVIIRDNATDLCILGMQWNQCQDTFQFLCKLDTRPHISKRAILSEVTKLFDPLGLLGPVIMIAKLMLQDLWQLAIQWDESVPQDIHTRWIAFRTKMSDLIESTKNSCVNAHQLIVEVYGFCDASQRAFGACIYIRAKLGIKPLSYCAQSFASHRSRPSRYRN